MYSVPFQQVLQLQHITCLRKAIITTGKLQIICPSYSANTANHNSYDNGINSTSDTMSSLYNSVILCISCGLTWAYIREQQEYAAVQKNHLIDAVQSC